MNTVGGQCYDRWNSPPTTVIGAKYSHNVWLRNGADERKSQNGNSLFPYGSTERGPTKQERIQADYDSVCEGKFVTHDIYGNKNWEKHISVSYSE